MKNDKHDCVDWFEEAMGCAICHNLLLKSPIKTKKELLKLIDMVNWHMNQKDKHIGELEETIKNLEKTKSELERIISRMLLRNVKVERVKPKEYLKPPTYDKVSEGYITKVKVKKK